MATAVPIPYLSIPQSRARRLQDELQFALRQVSRAEMTQWGAASAGQFGTGLWRRSKSLVLLTARLGHFVISEVREVTVAGREHRLSDHAGFRAQQMKDAGSKGTGWLKGKVRSLPDVARNLRDQPLETAPRMLGAAVGFLTGSGGLDANGGLLSPDVDLFFGIGAHRSVLTHSLILGAAAEATILSVAELAKLVQDKLPAHHDILWDHLASHGQNFATGLATGYGIGLAYHLGVDATVQVGSLHGIPVPMPMEAHQLVMLGSAISEVAGGSSQASQRTASDP